MWVYIFIKGMAVDELAYEVGFYDPTGAWIEESPWDTPDEAAARCSYLNGGAAAGNDE